MIEWKNMLLVAGTGRNVGKTTFVCNVIKHISHNQPIMAIKISPHLHDEDCSHCKVIFKCKDLIITEETSINNKKDSSKMLAAGAQKVYYIQCDTSTIKESIRVLKEIIPDSVALVCESAALREKVNPGYFVLMSGKEAIVKNKHLLPFANKHIVNFNYESCSFLFENNGWKFKDQ